jgi:hypothetical protein
MLTTKPRTGPCFYTKFRTRPALDVSHASAKKMMQRLRETIEKSLGALLVSRRAVDNPNNCPDLDEILTGWDGEFTVLMRKRIARHIESCPVCDEERRRMVTPAALLGASPAFIPAPDWLRARTLEQIQLPGSPSTAPGGPSDGEADSAATRSGDPGARHGRRRVVIGAAVVAALVAAGLGLGAARMLERAPDVSPADLTHKVTPSSAPIPQSPNVLERSPAVTSAPPASSQGPATPVTGEPTAPATSAAPSPPAPIQTGPTQSAPTAPGTLTTTQVFPVRPAPTAVSEPPTFTAPPSQTQTTTPPPATVFKPPRPIRGPGTVIKQPPVTTTPPILQ